MKPESYKQYLEFALGVPFSTGNTVIPLKNGDEIFPAMLGAIASAETRIEFLTHVYWRGDIAIEFARALAERARCGVSVRVLLDAYGAKSIDPECLQILENATVELRWFRPLGTWRLWRTDKRTHRKILIVDKRLGFTGGVGIADEWCGDARSADEWRDTHFEIFGPAVAGLNAAFLDNWNEAGEWYAGTPEESPIIWSEESIHHDQADAAMGESSVDAKAVCSVAVQVIRSSSTVEWTKAACLYRALVAMARESLTIVTPYFAPDETLVKELCAAAKRGIHVQIMVPGEHCDSPLSQLAGFRAIEALLESGVRVYLYHQTLLHLKLLIADQLVSSIGSTNLNHRSMGKDEECNANVVSAELAAILGAHFDEDARHAEQLSLERWRQRSSWLRAKEFFARLLIEQL